MYETERNQHMAKANEKKEKLATLRTSLFKPASQHIGLTSPSDKREEI